MHCRTSISPYLPYDSTDYFLFPKRLIPISAFAIYSIVQRTLHVATHINTLTPLKYSHITYCNFMMIGYKLDFLVLRAKFITYKPLAMKKTLLLFLFFLTTALAYEAYACGSSTPYISGPDNIKNNSPTFYRYTLNMQQSYKDGSCGGYTGTTWTLEGRGQVGTGASILLNTNGWDLADGLYTLTATNSFVNGCTQEQNPEWDIVFTKQIRVARPDLDVHSPYLDEHASEIFFEDIRYGSVDMRVLNRGLVPSEPNYCQGLLVSR